jgi:predicted dehydrogenase
LLARDDAENHLQYAQPFIKAGLPIYIDKPICLSSAVLDDLYYLQQYSGQIFSCTGLRYAQEFEMTNSIRTKVGKLRHIYATTPKDWDKYGVHVIEPLLMIAGDQGGLVHNQNWRQGDTVIVNLLWESGFQATISALGKVECPIGFRIIGELGWHDMQFNDTFAAFKGALTDFVAGVIQRDVRADPVFVRRVVQIIEKGRQA